MKPSLDDLALLVTIAEAGSFTAAAEALGLPKSTVSRRLADLELLLRTSLFRRSTRALSLTDEGRRIYEMAQPSILAAGNAARAIAEREQLVAGRVSLTTTAALGQYLIAPHLVRLTADYPDLKVDLQLTERRINIIGESVDLAVRMGNLGDSDLIARRLCMVRRLLVASPAYLAQAGTPLSPSDLAAHNAIVTSAGLDTWRFDGGWECVMRWNIAAGNMLVAHQLARLGHGIALLPDFMIANDLKQGILCKILPDYPPEQADAWIVTSRQRYRSLAVQTVLNDLVEATGGRELAGETD
ncbi:LysR family transcriptional regulator [Gluconacetobacter entanii]|uniref:LysR family transcriptional regulator n=1 Tax=Gluconacetobacter entanii TaxID=108528 RepID=A0ABT3K0Z1_9PROT|nr:MULTISPECIES: LysR family transcriptional regulator [Acetobacteraceae]MCW4589079.1 LysR family transcriptional regulator [Gluconacetobacter entanii]MCW4592531.1 LysR family transcriptional regulator [Gluconacetobacter entanii]NPC90555.1 LysR family transcriptional regulator [Gluconacetobacter entanii]